MRLSVFIGSLFILLIFLSCNCVQGRFHHVLLVPLPDEKERILLLNYFAKKCGLLSPGAAEAGEDLAQRLREGMSGAEIENMCREATLERHRSLMQ